MDWGSLASSAMSALTGGSLPLGDWSGGWTNFSSGQSKLKDALRRQYDYAYRYSLEGPSWTVQGLRKAGINPILSVNSGNIGSVTTPNPSMAEGGSGSFSFSRDISKSLRKKQENVADKTAENIEANTDKVRSDIEVNTAKKANIEQDTINKGYTGGHTGVSAGVNALGHVVRDTFHGAVDSAKDDLNQTKNYILDLVRRVGSRGSNTAKSVERGMRLVTSALDRFEPKFTPQQMTPHRLEQHRKDVDSMKRAHRHHH